MVSRRLNLISQAALSTRPLPPFGIHVRNGDRLACCLLQHVVGRLFYPCDPQQPAGSAAVQASTPWLPAWAYATGAMTAAKIKEAGRALPLSVVLLLMLRSRT